VQEYASMQEAENGSALARLIIRFGRLLDLSDDELPLRGEHYRLLFTE